MRELIFEQHPGFVFLCLLAGLAYAVIQYQKKGPWSDLINKLMAVLRGLLVALIALLLVSPIIKLIINQTEQPTYVIAVDNSRSIEIVNDSTQVNEIKQLVAEAKAKLEQEGFRVELWTLEGKSERDDFNFTADITNLSALFDEVELNFEGRNLGGVTLFSDGIYNEGMSPAFSNYSFPINTVGIGDTIPKADIAINAIQYNRLSYQGNKFPLLVQIDQQGYAGEKVNLKVTQGNRLIESREMTLKASGLLETQFLIEAKENGYQRFTVAVERKEGEYTYENNIQTAYVEVIEGKETIAIVAPAPHPDIKAIKSAIESNANYSVELFLLSNSRHVNRLRNSPKNFDLIIYHQLPDRRRTQEVLLTELDKKQVPEFTILGAQSDLRRYGPTNEMVNISTSFGEYDNTIAAFNKAFESFKLSDELQAAFDEFPPISVPFGKYELVGDARPLLFQQVGSIVTTKPLVAVSPGRDKKRAIMMGEGLWKWKLTDYANYGNNKLFNEFISKLVQYLSSKDDKRKFRVYPTKAQFSTIESVVFETEVYNDLYEEVFDIPVDLILEDEAGVEQEFNYTTSATNTKFSINDLQPGVYKFKASASLGDKIQQAKGEIVVQEVQLESLKLMADYALLKRLSEQTGGEFSTQVNSATLRYPQAQGVIHSNEQLLPFINLTWLLFALIGLVSIEWFLRKYHGSY